MKKLYFFTLLNLFLSYSQAQVFQWAKDEGLWAYDYGYGTGVDNSGNLYVSGKYEENAIFSGITLNNVNINHDGFLAKYNSSGGLTWVRTFGGTLGDYSHGMYCDGSNAVYTAGEIEGVNELITFPGSTITLTSVGDNDIFFAKYDLSGNLLWAKSEGWYKNEKALGITSDSNNNIYVCGYFNDTTYFNGAMVSGFGGEDIFIAKYDSNGAFQWVKTAGSSGRDEAKSIKCDPSGNIYICGLYSNGANFSGTTLSCSAGFYEAYVAKYAPDGSLQWVKSGGGAYDDVAWSLTIDNQNKIYISGEFNAYAMFGPTGLTTTGNADAFVACYDGAGNEQWAVGAGGGLIDRARGIGTDGTNLFITGQFGSTAMFGSQSVTAADSSDIFVTALNNNGVFLWASSVGGAPDSLETLGYESGNSVCAEAAGNVYATGGLLNGGTFGTSQVSPYKRTDVFVTKLNTTPAGIHENSFDENVAVYPNPGKGNFTIDVSRYSLSSIEITLYNCLGQCIENRINKCSSKVNVDISSQPDGIYLVEIRTPEQIVIRKKLVLQH